MQEIIKLFAYLKSYKKSVFLSIFCHILMALFTIISIPLVIPFFHFLFSTSPQITSKPDSYLKIIDWLQYYFVKLTDMYGPEKTLILVCVFLIIVFLLKNLFRYLAMYFMVPVRSNIVSNLRSNLYLKYLQFSLQEKQDQTKGDLITRITNDAQEVEWSILRFIDAVFKSPIIIIGAIVLMLSISPQLTLFVFALMLFTLLVIGTLSKKLKKQSIALQNELSSITSTVDETLDGSLLINVYRVTDVWKSKFDQFNKNFKNIFDEVTRRKDLSSPLSEFLGITVVVVLLWYGAKLVMNQQLKPETFFAFVIAFYHVIEPLKSFSTAFYNIKKGSASLDRINSFIPKTKEETLQGIEVEFKFKESILFKNVSYAYDQQKVLNDVNLEIKKGEKIAIVGPSGAGKSTIVKLLLKMLSADSGAVLIDGKDIHDYSKESLYRQIGLVTQKAFLYNDTIYNNLTLGRSNITIDKIKASLCLAKADEFIASLNDGIKTVVGDKGDRLSGGEQQRLTIARALLEDPTLLIFDEPTSSLDPESEKAVSLAIMNALKDRTAIIIAHRLSTIKFADRILVLKNGKIVESGTHEELINLHGVYTEYVEIQSIN